MDRAEPRDVDGRAMSNQTQPCFEDLRALFVNCTLKRSPGRSNTDGLIGLSSQIMRCRGVEVEELRAIDHDIATGVWPDMTEQCWAMDEWPAIYERVLAADILVLRGPIWLGDRTSQITISSRKWMSTVGVSARNASNASHVHEVGSSTAPRMRDVHSSSGVRASGTQTNPGDPDLRRHRTGRSRSHGWLSSGDQRRPLARARHRA